VVALLVFAAVLLAAILVSELAERSVLSTAVVFLVAGFAAGRGGLGLLTLAPTDPFVSTFLEVAIFAVLFVDGAALSLRELAEGWRLPGRALVLGMPATIVVTALLAAWVAGLPWNEAFLVAAVLSPTDPAFAAALVGNERVPQRLRRLLNVESGLNDAIALPVVLLILHREGQSAVTPLRILGDLALGVVLGVAVPWAAIRLERSRFFAAADRYRPLLAMAIALLLFASCALLHANSFLAAFAGGMAVASLAPPLVERFHPLGEPLAELLKLAAILLFGALLTPRLFAGTEPRGYLFAALVLLLARPLALAAALLGSRMPWREWVAAAWFGPKGFASVLFGLLVLRAGGAEEDRPIRLIALVIVASIVLHSSTDVLVARWFEPAGRDDGGERGRREPAE
jgi:NhaP-type Na+/H+ or K+/H+ antiporter